MSALGQKQTHAVQQRMSALPPIATAKADMRKWSCPLYPRKQTCAVQMSMSALGQKRTSIGDARKSCPMPSDVRLTSVLRVDCCGQPRSHGFLIEYPYKRGCYQMIGPRVLAGNELAIDDYVGLEVDLGCGHLAAGSRERLRHVEVHLRVKYVVLDPLLFRG